MTIIRSPREHRDFTIISNSVCLDPRLSMRALGLLVRLLCRPDNWQTNSETLAREFECGREQIRGVLRELSQSGYMELRKTQSDNGRWSSVWHVFDRPIQGEKQPKQATPEAGKPGPGKPYFGELGAITRTDSTRTDNNPHTPKGDVHQAFTDFWKAYPKKVGKDAAERAWARKVKTSETIDAIMKAVATQKAGKEWTKDDGQYIPNPATWLNQGRWKDEGVTDGEQSDGGSWRSNPAFAGVI